jgi:hypothetical protein
MFAYHIIPCVQLNVVGVRIVFRYKCQFCKNHDFCEACYDEFGKGSLQQTEQSARVNPISKKCEDHKFDEFADKVKLELNTTPGALR